MTQPRSIAFRKVSPSEVVLDALERLSAALEDAEARISRRPAAVPTLDEADEGPLLSVIPVEPS
ncbi:MAG TPA: hypothetical protein VI997_09165 [Candidatus Thermoplasmatota archaeon]|nr:hypothetical protein [Candidatus Thermoplasmatota archaeon]